jgi:NADPH-dependent glutamate synthase beta subunit-like oxidoreductase
VWVFQLIVFQEISWLRKFELIEKAGVEIRTGHEIDGLSSLYRDGYEAVFIATGAPKPLSIGIEGEELPEVIKGLTCCKVWQQVNLLRWVPK